MLSRPEAQSFTKFLASLGLFLCVAAVSIPVLAFRDTSSLRIPESELRTFTTVAQQELKRRQDASRVANSIIFPWGAGCALIIGAALLGVALPRLLKQEKADDERAAAELSKLKAELEPQTDEEVEANARQEAVSEVEPDLRVPLAHDASALSEVRSESLLSDRVRRYQDVEKRVLDRVAEAAPSMFVLHPHVKVDSPARLQLDGVLRPKDSRVSDLMVEIKVVDNLNNLRLRVDDVVAHGMRFRRRVDPTGRIWLILVLGEAVPLARASDRVAPAVQDFEDFLTVSLVPETEIDQLRFPAELRR
jgi:uncharacterized membrane-anchored protein YhcB (DUF1043 family)